MVGIRGPVSVHIPHHNSQLSISKFSLFLSTHGAELLTTTNEWEVMRVRIRGQTSVLYKNKTGGLTWDSKLEEAYRAWKGGKKWSGLNGTKVKNRPQGAKRSVLSRSIAERDGDECWFCGKVWDDESEATLEHLLEVGKGGSNHIYNLVLACFPCNESVQDMSVAEKVQYREVLRFGSGKTELKDGNDED